MLDLKFKTRRWEVIHNLISSHAFPSRFGENIRLTGPLPHELCKIVPNVFSSILSHAYCGATSP